MIDTHKNDQDRSGWRRYGPLALLLIVIGLAWCSANGIWTPSAMALPTSYLDLERSDLFQVLAFMKAGTEGSFVPCVWKQVAALNAPFQANWNDWPTIEELQYVAFAVLAKAFGLFVGLNVGLLLGHLCAGAALYAVARAHGCNTMWAVVAGITFGLAPFLFAQSPHHFTVELVWHLPLFLLVWRWVSTEPGIEPWSRRFWQACGIGFLAGLQNPYFTNILCQLTLLGAGIQWLRNRSRRAFLSACAVVAAAVVAFCLMNIDTWTYKFAYGPNEGALVREYKWLEIYGLKIKDLFIPPVTHRWDSLANFSKAHRQVAPLLDEGASYQGIVGLACLVWLALTAVKDMLTGREKEVPMEAWQVLWIVLMFTTGGFNALFAAATGFTMFRTSCRYSIVILAITLLWGARRLSVLQAEAQRTRPAGTIDWRWIAAAACTCLVILWDQVPRGPTAEEKATIARLVNADREFTEKMEAALPDGAMVFQMPVMEFPESPLPGVPPYDHFRPYLYSKNLRYSFGSMKGREREKWQPAVQAKFFEGATVDQQAGMIRVNPTNARAAIDELKRLGFSAVYVNRNGFGDRAKGVEDVLLELGYTDPPIRNRTGDLACFVLDKHQAGVDAKKR